MNHYRLERNGKTTVVPKYYKSLDQLGYYLLMRDMHDSELGKFSIRRLDSILSYLEVMRDKYCIDLTQSNLSLSDVSTLVAEDLTEGVKLSYIGSNEGLRASDVSQVYYSIEKILKDSLETVNV